jgi:hypothetical protein
MEDARSSNKAAAAAAKAADKVASGGLSDAKVEKIYSVYMQAISLQRESPPDWWAFLCVNALPWVLPRSIGLLA